MLAFLLNTNFRWLDMDRPVKHQMRKARSFKTKKSARSFFEPNSRCLKSILAYAYELEFAEEPNYDKIKHLLKSVLLDEEQLPHKKFDWSYDHPDGD